MRQRNVECAPERVVRAEGFAMPSHDALSVLVVEDEPLLRLHAATYLEESGFEIYEAATAAEAIDILERSERIDAVFADIDLPGGLSGIELAAVIRRRWPPVRLVLTSGAFEAGHAALPSNVPFLAKPYLPDHLVGTLRSL